MTDIYNHKDLNCRTDIQQINTLFEMGKQLENQLIDASGEIVPPENRIYRKERMNCRSLVEQLNMLYSMGSELEAKYQNTDVQINDNENSSQEIETPIYRKDRMNCRTNLQQLNVLFEMGKELEALVNTRQGVTSITVDGVEYFPDENGNISFVVDAVKRINFDGDLFTPNQDGTVSIESKSVKKININGIDFSPNNDGLLVAMVDTSTKVIYEETYYSLVCDVLGDESTLVDYTTYWLLTTNTIVPLSDSWDLSSSGSLQLIDENTNYIVTV